MIRKLLAAAAALVALAAPAARAQGISQPPAAYSYVTPTGGNTPSLVKDIAARVLTLKDFGAKGDAALYGPCTMSSGSAVLSCSGTTFNANQVGKMVVVRGAGAAGGTLITTSLSVSGGNLTLAATASTAITGVYWQQALIGTDDTTAINNFVSAVGQGQTGRITKGWYLTTTGLNLNGLQSRTFKCDGDNRQSTDSSSPQLTLVASGSSASLVTMRSNAISLTVEGCGLTYFAADYSGNLIDLGDSLSPSSGLRFINNRYGGLQGVLKGTTSANTDGTQPGPAAALINIRGVYDVTISGGVAMRAQTFVAGPTDTFINANGVRIERVMCYGGFAGACILVSGANWSITDLITEPYNLGYTASASWACAAIAAQTMVGSPPSVYDGLSVRGGTFEDSQLGNGTCIDLSVNGSTSKAYGTSITGVQFNGGNVGVKPPGGSGFQLQGNVFRNVTLAWDLTSANLHGAGVGSILFTGNGFQASLPGSTVNSLTQRQPSHIDYIDPVNDGVSFIDWIYGNARHSGFVMFDSLNPRPTCSTGFSIGGGYRGLFINEQAGWNSADDRFTGCQRIGGATYGPVDFPVTNYLTATSGTPIKLTGQTASIATTNLRFNGSAVAPAGLYRIDYYLTVTTGGSGATVLTTFAWQDAAAARTLNSATVDASTTNYTQGAVVVRTDGTHDLSFATTLAGGSATYSLVLSVTREQ